MTLIRNPVATVCGKIDCEIKNPMLGWIPFTASADDPEDFGRDIYARAVSGEFGTVAPPGEKAIAASEKEKSDFIIATERKWRDKELARADVQVNKIEDGEPGVTGTLAEWREYRVNLRSWPDSEFFPQYGYRPQAPDLEKSL